MLSINGWCPFQNEQINSLCGHERSGLCFACCLSDSQSLGELTLLCTWFTYLVLSSSVRESEKVDLNTLIPCSWKGYNECINRSV